MLELGILDYAQLDEGATPREALQGSVELAQTAEELGFKRFWVAEHHDVPAFASSSPELLMMQILNQTSTIRVGSGGVMLPHYASLKVAENFRMLEGFHPGRVDLGLGNTKGTPEVYTALNELKERFKGNQEAIEEIIGLLTDDVERDPLHEGMSANPKIDSVPKMWLLSSSVRSARVAAKLGLGYVFGLFPYASKDRLEVGIEASKVYREEFQPSAFLDEPRVIVAPFLAVAESEEEGMEYAQALDLWLLGKDNFGELAQFPSIETAKNYDYSDVDKKKIANNRIRSVVGGIDSVTAQLNDIADKMAADEILLVPLMPGLEARKEALRLLSKAFNLKEN